MQGLKMEKIMQYARKMLVCTVSLKIALFKILTYSAVCGSMLFLTPLVLQIGQFDAISSGINVNPGNFLAIVKIEVLKTFHWSPQSSAAQDSQSSNLQFKVMKPLLNLFPPKRYNVLWSGWGNKALPLSYQLEVLGPSEKIHI